VLIQQQDTSESEVSSDLTLAACPSAPSGDNPRSTTLR
jgi:hypothetical protein